jgi:hypothetical protein
MAGRPSSVGDIPHYLKDKIMKAWKKATIKTKAAQNIAI